MARKGVFETLMSLPPDGEEAISAKPDAKASRSAPRTRALMRMDQSIQELQKSAIQEIPLDRIDQFEFHDRIDIEEDLDGLAESLRDRGQEVPIKVRPIPDTDRFEVIIGRRRCAAARRIGWKTIRGVIQEHDDIAALAAMITENSERRETSYIGKARLCAKVIERGISQSDLARAMGCSQGHISQMLRSYKMLGDDVILAVGDAVGRGRSAWDPVWGLMEKLGMSSAEAAALVDRSLPSSTVRLQQLNKALEARLRETPPAPSKNADSAEQGSQDLWRGKCQVKRSGNSVTIKRLKGAPDDMLDFIQDRLPDIIKEYREAKSTG